MNEVKSKDEFKKRFKQRLYSWVLNLISLIDGLPKSTSSNVIGKQLMRSGTSILANYVEATSASSIKDFQNFFNHSLKSANESEIWLNLLKDTNQGNKKVLDNLSLELEEFSKILAKSILTIKRKKVK